MVQSKNSKRHSEEELIHLVDVSQDEDVAFTKVREYVDCHLESKLGKGGRRQQSHKLNFGLIITTATILLGLFGGFLQIYDSYNQQNNVLTEQEIKLEAGIKSLNEKVDLHDKSNREQNLQLSSKMAENAKEIVTVKEQFARIQEKVDIFVSRFTGMEQKNGR